MEQQKKVNNNIDNEKNISNVYLNFDKTVSGNLTSTTLDQNNNKTNLLTLTSMLIDQRTIDYS